MKYYLDTCIWRDHYENRIGFNGRPLGDYATKLFSKIMKNKDIVLFSSFINSELKIKYNQKEINDMIKILSLIKILKYVKINQNNIDEAKLLSKERRIPMGDALHAILARNNKAVLITQDMKDYNKLRDIAIIKKPEEII